MCFRPLAGVLVPVLGLYTYLCFVLWLTPIVKCVCVYVFICVCVCASLCMCVPYVGMFGLLAGVVTPILGLYTWVCVWVCECVLVYVSYIIVFMSPCWCNNSYAGVVYTSLCV